MKTENPSSLPLWTRDFTIITIGSVVSMFGNSLSGFAMSLMVLDISHSTLLYALYIVMFTLPQLFMPIVSGAILDRFSRKKMIYTLDFISSFLYLLMAAVLATGWFSFPFFAAYCFILGCIQSTYMVAYDSFYPLLITEGNFQKAYSIASVLETLSAVMIPVSIFLYRMLGLSPLLAINALCFFIAAFMETKIKAEEDYLDVQKETKEEGARRTRQVLLDIRDGFPHKLGDLSYVITIDPIQYIDQDYQHMYDIITEAIWHEPLVQAVYEPVHERTIAGLKLTVYRRTGEYTPEIKQYFYDKMLEYYPDKGDYFAYILE